MYERVYHDVLCDAERKKVVWTEYYLKITITYY